MASVKLKTVVEKMDLKNLTPEIDMNEIEIIAPDINRPALQLAGFFDHFDSARVQVIGYVEYAYIQTVPEEDREKLYYELMSFDKCVYHIF